MEQLSIKTLELMVDCDFSDLWRVHAEFSNGDIQDTESTGGIPDQLDELLFSLSEFFE